jgi:ThiF family
LRHGDGSTSITDTLITRFSFSNKPPEGYQDHYQMVTTYVAIISGPVQHVDENAKAQTWRVLENQDPASVFVFADTASSRAGITAVTRKLETGPVAIVGLGGTGSYVLDLMAKTPVAELHLFDGDRLGQHNAFRAPGAPTIEQLRARPFKVDFYAETYSRMRRRIVPHPFHVDAATVSELETMSFVFICMDVGTSKRIIVDTLVQRGIPFIDVGMGVNISDNDGLRGILRVTTFTPEKADHIGGRISFTEDGNNVYDQNIQIADLNALNAALAVLRWKKLRGFYEDLKKEHFSAYSIDVGKLVNEDMP